MVVLKQKNSMHYINDIGANVGDIIMSVGYTLLEAGLSPFEYFVDILLNKTEGSPVDEWLPWNWKKRKSEFS